MPTIFEAINNETAHPFQLYLMGPDGKPIAAMCDGDGNLQVGGITLEGDVITNSEFPEAAELSGIWPITTETTIVGSAVMGSDGDNEVLIGGDGTYGLDVDVTRLPGIAGDVPSGDSDSGNPLKIGGIVIDPLSLPSPLTAGQRGDVGISTQKELLVYLSRLIRGEDETNNLLATIQKKLASANYSASLFTDFGANVTLNVKATAGNIYAVTCRNYNGANRFLQLHNTATTPAGGAVPRDKFLIPPGQQIIIGNDYFQQEGIHYTNGIAFAFSTTERTYTAGVAGDQDTTMIYI